MIKHTMKISSISEIEISSTDIKSAFKDAALFSSLPSTCPVDGSPIKLSHRDPGGFDYYELLSADGQYRSALGETKVGGVLYYKGIWTRWDGQTEVEVWNQSKDTNQQAPPQAPPTDQEIFASPPRATPEDVWGLVKSRCAEANGGSMPTPNTCKEVGKSFTSGVSLGAMSDDELASVYNAVEAAEISEIQNLIFEARKEQVSA